MQRSLDTVRVIGFRPGRGRCGRWRRAAARRARPIVPDVPGPAGVPGGRKGYTVRARGSVASRAVDAEPGGPRCQHAQSPASACSRSCRASLPPPPTPSTGRPAGNGPPTAETSATPATPPWTRSTADNFSDLELAWRFRTANLGPGPEYVFQSTPLMVDGVLYTTAGTRRAAVALDAATGELLWVHRLNEGARGAAAPRRLSGRGLTYWDDGGDGVIFYVTPGYRLIALNAPYGPPRAGLRRERPGRPEAGPRPGARPRHRRDRAARGPGRRRRGRRHRRRPPRGRRARHEGEADRARPRLRRPDRRAAVDLPHHSRRRRVRQRHVAGRLVALYRQPPACGAR